MADLFLDTFAGQVIRTISGNHLCPLPDPTKSGVLHKHDGDYSGSLDGRTEIRATSTTSEPEKGGDIELVSWYGDDDPAVSFPCPS